MISTLKWIFRARSQTLIRHSKIGKDFTSENNLFNINQDLTHRHGTEPELNLIFAEQELGLMLVV